MIGYISNEIVEMKMGIKKRHNALCNGGNKRKESNVNKKK